MSRPLKLIVGIGNPGAQYADTRHNAGVWLLSRFANRQSANFAPDKKFFGEIATTQCQFEGTSQEVRLLLPSTYMNESGKSVGAVVRFYKYEPEEVLIVHDELDLATGVVRYKQGGGLAGHNGLRDIAAALGGSQAFNRIRIGVGHPGEKSEVTGHVLGRVSAKDRDAIDQCIDEALRFMPLAISGNIEQAMNEVNGFKAQ